MKQNKMFGFMDFKEAANRVLKKWYETRIQEETDRNKKLRDLHYNLTKIKIMQEEEIMKTQLTTPDGKLDIEQQNLLEEKKEEYNQRKEELES